MKYPIGIQSFDQIINGGYVYVDKTELVYRLVTSGKIYFLSRPRRFGKSLLVSTLKSYFQGRKELFEGLAIAQLEKEWAEYPVFHIDFNGVDFTQPDALDNKLEGLLASWESRYGKTTYWKNIGDRFAYVLRQAHRMCGRRCVVLVDEYDKPMLDVLDGHGDKAEDGCGERRRDILKGFYSVFKAADEDLHFVLLTGVTKFSQVSVFSGFNQPADISMNSRYEALCGITQDELERYFAAPIHELAGAYGCSDSEMKARLKFRYDGYHFGRSLVDVYNPFSLLNAFDMQELQDYWFATGTPSYLLHLLSQSRENLNELTGRYYLPQSFVDYKSSTERALPMLYQSGYLTIKAYNPDMGSYLLDFPNNEVKNGFVSLVASDYLRPYAADARKLYKIGASFSSRTGTVEEWRTEQGEC